MISIIVPSHAISAVRGDDPTGTTADKMRQSPKRDSWVTTVLVDEVMSEGDEDSMSSFSQPERVKSIDIQRIKILKYLQLGGGKTNDAGLAAGLRLVAKVSLVYVFEAFIITFIDLITAKVQRFFETTKYFRDFFLPCRLNYLCL